MSPLYSHTPVIRAQSRSSLIKAQKMLQEEDPRFRSLDRMLARAFIEMQRRRAQQQRSGVFVPRMDLYDDPENNFVTAVLELPGMKPNQLSVRIENGHLIIEGERAGPRIQTDHRSASSSEPTQQAHTLYPVQEIKYGKFRREVKLPEGVTAGHVRSMLAEGMLTISWPRDSSGVAAQTYNSQAAAAADAVPSAGYEGDDPGTA
ncbi:HSP20-like chaperone [Trametes gibbosa]|nr:HSP20-like chaperone [Trametes gibbosa]KAI0828153.1 HSP20-like chaperone [Trametes gibbosa]